MDIAKSMGMNIRFVRVIPQFLDISDMSYWKAAERKIVKKAMEWKRKRPHEREYKKFEKQIPVMRLNVSRRPNTCEANPKQRVLLFVQHI